MCLTSVPLLCTTNFDPTFQCPHFLMMDGTEEVRIIFRQYASLFFVLGVSPDDNVMAHFAFIHNLVETLNSYFRWAVNVVSVSVKLLV